MGWFIVKRASVLRRRRRKAAADAFYRHRHGDHRTQENRTGIATGRGPLSQADDVRAGGDLLHRRRRSVANSSTTRGAKSPAPRSTKRWATAGPNSCIRTTASASSPSGTRRARNRRNAKSEFRFLNKNTGVRWVAASVLALFDDAESLTGFVGTIVDLTDRKAIEDVIRADEARLRSILDNSPAIISLKDLEGRYVQVNRRWEELYAVSQ